MNLQDQILADADRCVMCGMCLPHCPTYGLSHNEAESPRGRISLMLAVARGQLEPDTGLHGHLDRCLGCRACEAMCPSQVPYGRLLRNTREYLYQNKRSLLADTLASTAQRGFTRRVLQVLRTTGLQRAAQAVGMLGHSATGRLLQGLPDTADYSTPQEFTPAQGHERGQVALFIGCTGDLLQRDLIHDTQRLLSALGFAVHIPAQQGCCGALYVQQGNGEKARHLAQQNLAAFAQAQIPIISVATGCGALLQEYGQLVGGDAAMEFAQRAIDINLFLADIAWPEELRLRPLAKKIAVHEACTQRNIQRSQQGMYTLLRRIPALEVVELPQNERCCGAAGSYVVDHPDNAIALQTDKIAALTTLRPQFLASANIGCAMHLTAGVRAAGLDIEVLHPITLLARQLEAL